METNRLSYFNLRTTDPAWNLAAEQYIFDCLPRDRTYFMLWQNDNAVIIGRYQNTVAEINEEYVRSHGVRVVRRLSGGGAVYHDMGNLNYTFIADAGKMESIDFQLFCRPIVAALREMGISAEINGRNDMTIEGSKFSGNSQYIRDGRVMHHGTILFDSNLSVVEKALHVDPEKYKAKGIASVRSRVTTVKAHLKGKTELEEFRSLMLNSILKEASGTECVFTEEDKQIIERIREERYATWEWNYGQSAACEFIKKKRFPGCGQVEAHVNTDRGIIQAIKFYGDFFSVIEPDVLAEKLIGIPMQESKLLEALKEEPVEQYFCGLHADELADLLIT